MRSRSFLLLTLPLLASFVAAALTPSAEAQNAPNEQAAPTLPAAFYDVDVREQLGFAADGAASASSGVTIAGRSRAPAGAPLNSQTSFVFNEFHGATHFIIDADSLLFRNATRVIDIAIAAIISVDEIRRPARNQATWVKVTYAARGEARQLFVRRTGTRRQDQILDALRAAIEQERAVRRPDRP